MCMITRTLTLGDDKCLVINISKSALCGVCVCVHEVYDDFGGSLTLDSAYRGGILSRLNSIFYACVWQLETWGVFEEI